MPNHNFVFFTIWVNLLVICKMEMNLYVIDVSLKMDTKLMHSSYTLLMA